MKAAALRDAGRFALLAALLSWPIFLALELYLPPLPTSPRDTALTLFGHMLAMGGPAVAALLLWRWQAQPAQPAFRWSRPADYLWVALVLTTLRTVTLLASALTEPGFLSWRSAWEADAVIVVLGSLTVGWLAGLGEEVGWCAYLLPRLTPAFGRFTATVISGAIRGLWHLPPLLLAASGSTTPIFQVGPTEILALVLSNVLFGALMGWLWFKRASMALVGWAHQWHDLTRDAAYVLVIGATASVASAISWSLAIHALGLAALLWIASHPAQEGKTGAASV